jgi:hypothetical protein
MTYADDLAKIALYQMNRGGRHRVHRDLDMHVVSGAVRPHAVGYQVALGEGLQQS